MNNEKEILTPNIIALYRHGGGLSVVCIDVKRHIRSHNYSCSCFWVLPNQESTRPSAHETKAFYVVVYSEQPDIKLTIPSEL